MDFQGIYCFDRGTVRFAIYPQGDAGPRVLADITEQALADVFHIHGEQQDAWLEGCRHNFLDICDRATTRYRADPAAPIVLETRDFH